MTKFNPPSPLHPIHEVDRSLLSSTGTLDSNVLFMALAEGQQLMGSLIVNNISHIYRNSVLLLQHKFSVRLKNRVLFYHQVKSIYILFSSDDDGGEDMAVIEVYDGAVIKGHMVSNFLLIGNGVLCVKPQDL